MRPTVRRERLIQPMVPRRVEPHRRLVSDREASSNPTTWLQLGTMCLIILATTTLAAAGLSTPAKVVYVAAAAMAAVLSVRRSSWEYLTLTLWFWTLTPLARRLVDYYGGFDPTNIMLAAPSFIGLLMLRDILQSTDLPQQTAARAGLLLLVPVLYGLSNSLVRGDVVSGLVASADWLSPLLYYFYFLSNWRTIAQAEPALRSFLGVSCLVLIPYGIVQYIAPLPWDTAWARDSGMNPVGSPIFGTLNSSGLLAIWIGSFLLLSTHFRNRLSTLLLPAGAILLLMTLVRSIAGTVLMGLFLTASLGGARTIRFFVVSFLAVICVAGGLAAASPALATLLQDRFVSVTDLGDDTSAIARMALYRAAPGVIADHPLGLGIGAVGRGALAADNSSMVHIDSGIITSYLTMGWVFGSLFILGFVVILVQAISVTWEMRAGAAQALTVTALAATTDILFTSITGFFAAIIWICLGYALSIDVSRRHGLAPA